MRSERCLFEVCCRVSMAWPIVKCPLLEEMRRELWVSVRASLVSFQSVRTRNGMEMRLRVAVKRRGKLISANGN